jgi:hypothetical protein
MGYSSPKKPFDLKQFLSEKAPPGRRGWRSGGVSTVRKPFAEAKPKETPKPDSDKSP